ncbi:MAG: histidyl-tRNA synthetase [Actinomycetia bacterium]|nr:histidyl-tRNA synthetase [Actinomycetes bacterium]
MLDVLPPESARWIDVVTRFAERARRFGFGLLMTPILEHYEVFQRVGENTDVVRKEMYEFVDRGGRHLALRPEGTAPVVRAFVQHRPPVPWKVWYVAPNFRAEQPQKGRYRQHWQLGAEVLGPPDPDIDVETIALAHGFYRDLGLKQVTLLINSMGDDESRARYVDVLTAYWREHASLLGDEMARAEANPLRILDSKREDWQEMLEHAPQLGEYLTDESRTHFEHVEAGLQALGIDYDIAPRLVRGFDYYTSTVFEFTSNALDAAQNAVGGGGRYDRLAADMGGPPTPGMGFGIGIERVLIACDSEDVLPVPEPHCDVFVVDAVGGTEATRLAYELREAGLTVERAYGGRAVKKQWSAADRSGAQYGVMLAPKEMEQGKVAVKDMRTGEQVDVPRDEVAAVIATRLEGRPS